MSSEQNTAEVTSDISLTQSRTRNTKKKRASGVLTAFLVIFLILIIIISNFIGKQFLNNVLFSLFFGFPLLVIYRKEIASYMPKNIANYLVTETEEAQEASQLVIGQINPYYTSEIMYMLIGIASLGISGFVLYRRRREFRGIIASLFFAITGAVFIIDLF